MDANAPDSAISPEMQQDQGLTVAQALALRESSEIYRIAADFSNDPLLITDAESRTLFWNKAAEKVFGYSASEVLGQDLRFLLATPESFQAIAQALVLAKTAEADARVENLLEVEGIKKDGVKFPGEVSLARIFHKSRRISFNPLI